MGSFSDFLELEILDQIFGAQAYTAPATLYFALATAATSDATTGTSVTEPSGNGYARQSATNNKTTWNTAAAGAVDNAIAITGWTASGGSWGTISDMIIADALTLGNSLAWGALTASKTVGDGDSFEFAAGAIDITLT